MAMNIWCLLVVTLLVVSVSGKVRYNSQLSPPYNIRLADMTGDGIAEFLLFSSDRVYATTTDFAVRGLAYLKLPAAASRIIHGKFTGGPKEVICAQEPSLGRLDCYVMSPNNDALWWWWYQGDFIGTQDVIIGDYNSDGYDDIMTYNPSTGAFQVYRWNPSTYFFEVMANWVPGNLAPSSGALTNYKVRAGDYNGDGRTDILLYNQNAGQVLVYIASYDTSISKYTMWWYFTSATGWGGSQWECLVANLNGDSTEDAVLHNTVTGQYLTYNLVWDSATQKPQVLYVDLGQIHQGTNSYAFFGKLKNAAATEDSGKSNIRDDTLVWSADWQLWVRADARHDGTKQTYWWAYSQYPLILNSDQDGDAIKTAHELGGYDPNNDGVSDGILPSYGASPFVKDIFVHTDFMAGPPGATYNYGITPTAASMVVSVMAGKGINMHIFNGSLVAYKANLGNPGFDWVADVDPIKNANFPATRKPFFHYCLFASKYNGGTSSGISRGIVAQDFIVTLGGTGGPGSTAQMVGTFLHELGHNLGLRHGSTDDTNYKPNHISIMNYNYQFTGIYKNNQYQFLYSDITCSNLNENALVESQGVQCVTGGVPYQAKVTSANAWTVVNTAFDWNRNGVIDSGTVAIDTNTDSSFGTIVGGINEWNALVYNGGSIGSAAKRNARPASEEYVHEPPISEIPTAPVTFKEDFSEFKLKPHHGPQVLDVPHRFPLDKFTSSAQAVVTRPNTSLDVQFKASAAPSQSGSVNSQPVPFQRMAPVNVFSSAQSHTDAAVNSALM